MEQQNIFYKHHIIYHHLIRLVNILIKLPTLQRRPLKVRQAVTVGIQALSFIVDMPKFCYWVVNFMIKNVIEKPHVIY